MDSYLSGRSQLGDAKKSKFAVSLPSQPQEALGELEAPPSENAETKELCGDCGSKVSYVTEDGRVTRIVVTCQCGQVTEIDCKYQD